MKKQVKGAWLLHHGRKLQATTSQDFDAIGFASKCGTLLSAISAEKQSNVTQKRMEALARANNISSKTEAPAILAELERQKLVIRGKGEYEVLGVTGHTVLEHTSTIFEESQPQATEEAVLEVSEKASEEPLSDRLASEFIADTYKLTKPEAANTLDLGEKIGFFDSEIISPNEKLLFNGNLFRRDNVKKVNAVLSSLSSAESKLVVEVNGKLQASGCLPLQAVTDVLGKSLFAKLHSIGMFDVSVVGNETGKTYFVTRPAAFSKFTNSIADDALDLAKALVASLTYGMTVSTYSRGKIQMITALMNRLISGGTVGPATAIGNDYQALELKGVVEVTPAYKGMFNMRLLKPEVGRLALAVIQDGDITAESVPQLPGAAVTEYINPEANREIRRKDSTPATKQSARNLLNEIRTGGLSR
jgi:hypothetical protein